MFSVFDSVLNAREYAEDAKLVETFEYLKTAAHKMNETFTRVLDTYIALHNEVIVNCIFGFSSYNCTKLIANVEYSTEGKCYWIELSDKQLIPGQQGALKLHLQRDNIDRLKQELPDAFLEWLVVFKMPMADLRNDSQILSSLPATPLSIPLGYRAAIALRRNINHLNPAQTHCLDNRTLYGSALNDLQSCRVECERQASLRECGCVRIGLDSATTTHPVCDPLVTSTCARGVHSSIMKEHDCPACQHPCHVVSYEPVVHLSRLSSARANQVLLKVYYEDFTVVETYVREAVTLAELLSSTAAALSLWLCLKLPDIIRIVYDTLVYLSWKFWNKKRGCILISTE